MDDFHQLRRPSGGGAFPPRDLGPSEISARRALARCRINMLATTTSAVAANAMNKGDVLATARVAGIQAAKQASSLLPMSHLVLVGNVYVNFTIGDTFIDVEASVDTVDRTGVEMEALMACAFAALSLLGSLQETDPFARVDELELLKKEGGRSGSWGKLVDDADATPAPRR